MRKQYHFRETKKGCLIWDVHRLVDMSQNLPLISIPLSEIKELDEDFWYSNTSQKPTCRSIVDHFKLIQETDLNYPIIMCSEGRVMDGMHRVCKALLEGEKTIKAYKFSSTPSPDYIDVAEDDLPYD
ncbi:MAG: hypothetical protein ABW201_09145 [Candidatus Thiodiazotropha sp.]